MYNNFLLWLNRLAGNKKYLEKHWLANNPDALEQRFITHTKEKPLVRPEEVADPFKRKNIERRWKEYDNSMQINTKKITPEEAIQNAYASGNLETLLNQQINSTRLKTGVAATVPTYLAFDYFRNKR